MNDPQNTFRDVAVADLRPGDVTPWYEVLAQPEQDGDEHTVRVRYTDTGNDGVVRGASDETVPVRR